MRSNRLPMLMVLCGILISLVNQPCLAQNCNDFDNHYRWLTRYTSPHGYIQAMGALDDIVVTAHSGSVIAIQQLTGGEYQELASLTVTKYAQAFAVTGTMIHALAGGDPALLYAIDISDPALPALVDSVEVAQYCSKMYQDGDRLYFPCSDNTLKIFDISGGGVGQLMGSQEYFTNSPNEIYATGGLLYLTGTSYPLEIWDVANPSNMALLGFIEELEYSPRFVRKVGDYLFGVLNYWYGGYEFLTIFDVSDPSAPFKTTQWDSPGSWDNGNSIYNIFADGDRLYVGLEYGDNWDDYEGLLAFNISDPFNVTLSAQLHAASEMQDMVPAGESRYHVAMAYNGCMLLDASNPTPAEPTSVYWNYWETTIYDVAVVGDMAYIAHYTPASLRVVNLSDPTAPVEETVITMAGTGQRLITQDGRAYLAYSSRFHVMDLGEPTVPALLGTFNTSGNVDVAVADTLAFLSRSSLGLQVVSINDPAAMFQVSTFDTPGYAQGIAYRDGHVFIADTSHGLRIIDVSDPALPEQAGAVTGVGYVYDVTLHGDLAYLACNDSGLRVVDISDPTNPILLPARGVTPHFARALAVRGNYLYVVDSGAGLLVFDIHDPENPLPQGLLPMNTKEGGSYSIVGLDFTDAGQVCFSLHSQGLVIAGRQCDPTPVWLSDFQVVASGAVVDLRWSFESSDSEESALRLAVTGASGRRMLNFERLNGDEFSARDDSPLLAAGGRFTYELEARQDGDWLLLHSETVRLAAAAPRLSLQEAWPNPFNPHTTLVVDLSHTGRVDLAIFNLAGRRLATVSRGELEAGRHMFSWDGRDEQGRELASGLYLARLAGTDRSESRKLMLLR